MTNHLFELAGNRRTETVIPKSKKMWYKGKPVVSAAILILIILGCLCAELIMTKDPTYMDLLNYNKAPDKEFLFGTDTMGRDIFSMIWYGGRISILIGGLATVISTFIAVVVGAFSGVAPAWLDELIMRFTEILKYTSSASDHFAAGYYGKCQYPESVLCNRCDQLDQYCESGTYRGKTDTKQ
jgi:peptide/nickel transport system permease protein